MRKIRLTSELAPNVLKVREMPTKMELKPYIEEYGRRMKQYSSNNKKNKCKNTTNAIESENGNNNSVNTSDNNNNDNNDISVGDGKNGANTIICILITIQYMCRC